MLASKPSVTRRSALGGAALIGGLGTAALGGSGVGPVAASTWASHHTSSSRPAPRAALPAFGAIDAVGVGVHLTYDDTPYHRADRVLASLRALGVRHIRDDLRLGHEHQYAVLAALAKHGIRSTLIAGAPRPLGDAAAQAEAVAPYVATLAQRVPSVEAIEGTNEWDHFSGGRPTWPRELREHQAALYRQVRAERALDGVPVLAPSLAFAGRYPQLGSLRGSADVANAHYYSGGQHPAHHMAETLDGARGAAGRSRVHVTETGYHDALNPLPQLAGHHGVSERVAAIYMPRMVLTSLQHGVERAFFYELLDQFPDPLSQHPENSFGLLRNDFTPKPSFAALRALFSALGDDAPLAGFSPQPLPLALSGPRDLRSRLFQRVDRSWVLALWRDVSVWNADLGLPVPVAPSRVRVRLGGRMRVTRHAAESPRVMGTRRSADFRVPIAGSVVLLRLQR